MVLRVNLTFNFLSHVEIMSFFRWSPCPQPQKTANLRACLFDACVDEDVEMNVLITVIPFIRAALRASKPMIDGVCVN